MAITSLRTPSNNKKHVSFELDSNRHGQSNVLDAPLDPKDEERLPHATNVPRDQFGSLPAAQGLYDPDNEKDSCVSCLVGCSGPRKPMTLAVWTASSRSRSCWDAGCRIRLSHQGKAFAQDCIGCQGPPLYVAALRVGPPVAVPSPASLSEAPVLTYILIVGNMTHRGATGADSRDGDGAGIMVGIPHAFFVRESERELGVKLPKEGEYAVGNVFFKKGNDDLLASHRATFEQIAESLNLRVLGWRPVPTDGTILGPAALSREPLILQPVVVLATSYGHGTEPDPNSTFDEKYFERQLYVLRKHATHTLLLSSGFYICSLSNKNVVYKGQLSPSQVYNYYHDL